MATWDIEETRRLVRLRFGAEQLATTRQSVRAVLERQRHARYHFSEARRLLREHIDDRLPFESIIEITWPVKPDQSARFNDGVAQMEAHVIACAQAIHAVADGLAHVAYFALGLNLTPFALKEWAISLGTVTRLMRQRFPEAGSVALRLEELAAHPEFKALASIVNGVKHRGLNPIQINVGSGVDEEAGPYAVEFRSFSIDAGLRPGTEIDKIIAPAYEAASEAVVFTGIDINALHSGGGDRPAARRT